MNNIVKFVILVALGLSVAAAQNDPPSRVGRLNYISGSVSFQPGGVDDWVPAVINRPLTTGDHLWTDNDSRAELHIGAAAVRLGPNTAFEFLNLDDQTMQIRLSQGSIIVRLRNLGENESAEIDTPNLAFSLLRPGEYRVDANPDTQTTTVTVRSGDGEVTGGSQAFGVHARQQARVTGAETVTYDLAGAPTPDDWERWCMSRDQHEERSESLHYVSRDMVGYEDLDEYGTWRTVPDYGAVWVPRQVAVGWTPYHDGRWVWVEPWGWTWIDDAPWGFAPFHYGRWAFVAGGWGWIPGPVAVRPVYAPALVAWVGGPRFSLSIGVGGGVAGVAWFPLGPREVYVPAYRTSPAYINRVNVTNTNITNVNVTNINVTNVRYANRNVPGAVVAAPQSALTSSQPIGRAAVAMNQRDFANAQVVTNAAVAPRQESVLGRTTGPGAGAPRPPAAAFNRSVVARTTPPPPPVPFAQRQAALSAAPGRPLDSEAVQRIRQEQPAPARSYVRPAYGQGGAPNTGNPRPQFTPRPNAPVINSQAPSVQAPNAPAAPAQGMDPSRPRYTERPNSQPNTPNARPQFSERPQQPSQPAAQPQAPAVNQQSQPAPRPNWQQSRPAPVTAPPAQDRRQVQQENRQERRQEAAPAPRERVQQKPREKEEEKKKPERP